MRKKVNRICGICGCQFERFATQKVGATGWICSKECRELRAIAKRSVKCMVCGVAVKMVGTKVVPKFCGSECKEKARLASKTKQCEQCGCDFIAKQCSVRFCSRSCANESRTKHKERQCLNCGKMHIPLLVSRSDYAGKHKFSNMFCSRKCSGKYKTWASDRKSKCRSCGKATGNKSVTKCATCPNRLCFDQWDRVLDVFVSRDYRHMDKTWDVKLNSMINTNRHREAISCTSKVASKKTRKRRNRTAWVDKWNEACSEMILKHTALEQKTTTADPWRKTLYNWQTNQRKRMRIKKEKSRLKECDVF